MTKGGQSTPSFLSPLCLFCTPTDVPTCAAQQSELRGQSSLERTSLDDNSLSAAALLQHLQRWDHGQRFAPHAAALPGDDTAPLRVARSSSTGGPAPKPCYQNSNRQHCLAKALAAPAGEPDRQCGRAVLARSSSEALAQVLLAQLRVPEEQGWRCVTEEAGWAAESSEVSSWPKHIQKSWFHSWSTAVAVGLQ